MFELRSTVAVRIFVAVQSVARRKAGRTCDARSETSAAAAATFVYREPHMHRKAFKTICRPTGIRTVGSNEKEGSHS